MTKKRLNIERHESPLASRTTLRIESTWNNRIVVNLDEGEVKELAEALPRLFPEHFKTGYAIRLGDCTSTEDAP